MHDGGVTGRLVDCDERHAEKGECGRDSTRRPSPHAGHGDQSTQNMTDSTGTSTNAAAGATHSSRSLGGGLPGPSQEVNHHQRPKL